MDIVTFAEHVLGQELSSAQKAFLRAAEEQYDFAQYTHARRREGVGGRSYLFLSRMNHRSDVVDAIDEFLSYTPTGQTDYGYALGWATAQDMLLCHLVASGVLERYEADWLRPKYPDRKWFIRIGRPRPQQRR